MRTFENNADIDSMESYLILEIYTAIVDLEGKVLLSSEPEAVCLHMRLILVSVNQGRLFILR